MNTNKSLTSLLASFAIGLAIPHASTAAAVPGYFDTSTGRFVPSQNSPAVTKTPAAAPVTATGTVNIVVALTIESAIGTDEVITCSASATVVDASFDNSVSTSGTVVRSGSKGSLTLSMPYEWTMAAAQETASVSLSCSESNSYSAYSTGGVSHSIYFYGSSFVVPASGTTTTIDKTATI